ncbi:MAG: hypothetical protein AAF191_17705 [Verrucomicrobiota bacterium]
MKTDALPIIFPPVLLLLMGIGLILPPSVTSADLDEEKKKAISEGFDAAQKTLRSFLESESWEAASAYALDAEHLKERMAAHYGKFLWTPLEVRAVRYDGGSEVSGSEPYFTHNFTLLLHGKAPVAATMVQVGEKYKIDWELFAQAVDNSFDDFLKGETAGPLTFRLSIHRGVPTGEQEKYSLSGGVVRLRAGGKPGVYFPGDLFVGKDTEIGKKVLELVPWEFGEPYRVEVKWNEGGFCEVVSFEGLDFSTPTLFD